MGQLAVNRIGPDAHEVHLAFGVGNSIGTLLGALWSLAWQFSLYWASLAEIEPDFVRLGGFHAAPLLACLVLLGFAGRCEILRGLADGVIGSVIVLDLAAALIWLGSA